MNCPMPKLVNVNSRPCRLSNNSVLDIHYIQNFLLHRHLEKRTPRIIGGFSVLKI